MPAGGAADGMKGMGGDGETALRVDEPNRLENGQARRNALFEIEPEEVPVQRADFLADHDVHPQLGMLARVCPGLARAPDLVVIGDREHLHAACGRAHDGLWALRPVAPDGVDVQIGPSGRQTGAPPLAT